MENSSSNDIAEVVVLLFAVVEVLIVEALGHSKSVATDLCFSKQAAASSRPLIGLFFFRQGEISLSKENCLLLLIIRPLSYDIQISADFIKNI